MAHTGDGGELTTTEDTMSSIPRSRRSPMPMMDPSIVVPKARFQRNRSVDEGNRFVIVDRVESLEGDEGPFRRVHYRCETTGRRGQKLMVDFCRRSEFIPAPLPPPPVEKPAPTEEPTPVVDMPEDISIEGRLATLESGQKETLAMLREIRDRLRAADLGPLFQTKAR